MEIDVPPSAATPNPASFAPHGPQSNVRKIFDRPSHPVPSHRIALVGTFAPRQCGIATFTTDIVDKLAEYHPGIATQVFASDDAANPHDYGERATPLDCHDPAAYREAARAINEGGVEAVWLQHEYGIFGGEDGEMICDFVDRLAAPLILTPHTVLADPSERQERILRHLVSRASRIMVMSRHSRDLLASRYGAPHSVLTVIEHGAPDRPFGRQEEFKQLLGLSGHRVLTTFGLLGPGKGLERVIEALPAIVARHPEVLYRIIGATHPNLVAQQGESYRDSLQALAKELGVTGHIDWVDRFVETDELLDQLEACDIYITPYPNMQQSTSGTLSYAVALGKAVISTPYLHAREILADGVGQLIEPHSSEAIAEAVTALLDDRERLEALQRRAYAKGRETIWPRFAAASAALVESACTVTPKVAPVIARPDLSGVFTMSDATGMLQHAIGIVPDRNHGYCLDDNARALMLMNLADGLGERERLQRAMSYASFVQYAWNPEKGAFRNFLGFDRIWREEVGSEDANGRAFWALGHTLAHAPQAEMRDWACAWFDKAIGPMRALQSPRAVAFVMLGAAERLRVQRDHGLSRAVLEDGGDLLHRLLAETRRPDWAWFETVLGYDNPRLPQALIEAGALLGRQDYLDAGLSTLEWIGQQQLSAAGNFRPIGSDSFGQEGAFLPFDQQPLEAHAAIDAARSALAATGDESWIAHAHRAWRWFFGANDRGAVLADMDSGRCRDGITPRGANTNCGAESILAFQLAHHSMLAIVPQRMGESGGERRHGARTDGTGHTLATT